MIIRALSWITGCLHHWIEGWMDGWMDGCMHACMHAWMDGSMDGWNQMDGRTVGELMDG